MKCFFFFFNDTATTEIYTLSLHDALPIYGIERLAIPYGNGTAHRMTASCGVAAMQPAVETPSDLLVASADRALDRKSTRLNSSHANISYAVFCLKKKKTASNRLILHGQSQ